MLYWMSLPALYSHSSSSAGKRQRQHIPCVNVAALVLVLPLLLISRPGPGHGDTVTGTVTALLRDVGTSTRSHARRSCFLVPSNPADCRTCRHHHCQLRSYYAFHDCQLFPSRGHIHYQLYSTISDNEAWRLASLNELGSRAVTQSQTQTQTMTVTDFTAPATDYGHHSRGQTNAPTIFSSSSQDQEAAAMAMAAASSSIGDPTVPTATPTPLLYRGVYQLTSENDYR
jgi:hypothetical protein